MDGHGAPMQCHAMHATIDGTATSPSGFPTLYCSLAALSDMAHAYLCLGPLPPRQSSTSHNEIEVKARN